MGHTLEDRTKNLLHEWAPYYREPNMADTTIDWFQVTCTLEDYNQFTIWDQYQGQVYNVSLTYLEDPDFNLIKWYQQCMIEVNEEASYHVAMESTRWSLFLLLVDQILSNRGNDVVDHIQLGGVQVDQNKYPALQRNAVQVKGHHQILPKPIVVKVAVNNQPARALLNSGSLGDFMSSTLADQLAVKRSTLDAPLSLQLAIQGLRSKVNAVGTVQFQYQGINETCTFDIINLNSYDLILGTPWMHQHQVCLGFNPAHVHCWHWVVFPPGKTH